VCLKYEKSAATNSAFLGAYLECTKDYSGEYKCRVRKWFKILPNGTNADEILKASVSFPCFTHFLELRFGPLSCGLILGFSKTSRMVKAI